MCSSSGGQNCIIQHLVSSHFVGGHPVHRLREDCVPPSAKHHNHFMLYGAEVAVCSQINTKHIETEGKIFNS